MIAVVSAICALMGLTIGFLVAKLRLSKETDAAKAEVLAASAAREREIRAEAELRIEGAKKDAARYYEDSRKLRDEDFRRQLESMESKFQAISERLLKERSEEFRGANREEMGRFSKPLFDALESMRKQMNESREGNSKNIAELSGALKNMMEQSARLGQNAESLAEALKNRGKVQGDWGEQVLENILADSGLRSGEEFFTQKSYTGKDGREYRPDVVVRASDGTMIIVDSKVSLTAYSNYVSAEDDKAREVASKENLSSVWNHVEELASKNYPSCVPDSLPYVLMFVPNEGSYILAMNRDPQIGIKAYRKRVLIINPTNLMLALSLILFTWKNTRQEENCAKIMKAAEELYEKFCTLSETFVKLGDQLDSARGTYDRAKGQLVDGRGCIVTRLRGMQQLGITSTKAISEKLTD